MRLLSGLALVAAALGSPPEVLRQAGELYQHTEYEKSLHLLANDPAPDAASLFLSGKNTFMLGDYQKAIGFFEKAVAISPTDSDYHLWLGRAWGRRAESSNWMSAAPRALKARQYFEKAVALDPHNREAKNDLFDFYLNAPGIMGGGMDKAEAIAKSIANERPAEAEFEEAQLANRRKDYAAEEAHLRRAMQLAPTEPGRVVDLARYLAKHGRLQESDQLFAQAMKLAPGLPRVAFAQARTDIENNRNRDRARALLESYLHSSLTPDDPPRQEAERLLRRAGG